MKGRQDVSSNCLCSGLKSNHHLQTIGSVHRSTSTQHRETIKERSTDPEPKIWAASPDENTPRGLNQAVRPIPGGHGTEGVPPSWSLHRVRASVWASRVQVKPPGAAGRREAVVPAGTLSPACAALWHPGRSPSSGLGRGGTRPPPAPVAAKPLNQRSSLVTTCSQDSVLRGVEA